MISLASLTLFSVSAPAAATAPDGFSTWNIVVVVLAFLAPTAATVIAFLLQKRKVQEIHVLVNRQRDELEARINQLEAFITEKTSENIPAKTVSTGG